MLLKRATYLFYPYVRRHYLVLQILEREKKGREKFTFILDFRLCFSSFSQRKESNFLLVSAFNLRVFILGFRLFLMVEHEQRGRRKGVCLSLIYDGCQDAMRVNYMWSLVTSDDVFIHLGI